MKKIRCFLMPALAVVFGMSLAACEVTVPSRTFPELTYRHLKPINLNVSSVEIVTDYKPSMMSPHVDHLFPTPPVVALNNWAAGRLIASGEDNLARFTILDASVHETALEKKKGIAGAFTKEQSERYDAMLEATLEVFDGGGRSKGFANARVSRSITVREDATVNDREQAWFDLTEALMKDINLELEKNISRYLAAWLK